MTEKQIDLVQSTWQMIVPVKEQTAELFYKKLFITAPEVKPLFTGDIKAQGEKLVSSINLVVNSLRSLDHVVPALQSMGERHVSYAVKAEHYDIVGATLLWTLEQGLGNNFTDEVKEAWTIAYGLIAGTMIDAANY
ncbi:MAG: hemin receptor [Methylomarinum sp.]|nr:hemin receptor [Methylomarinum sp.]